MHGRVLDVFGVDGVWIMNYWWFFTFHRGVDGSSRFFFCAFWWILCFGFRAFWNSIHFHSGLVAYLLGLTGIGLPLDIARLLDCRHNHHLLICR